AYPPPSHGTSRWRLALAWGVGALLAVGLIRLSYGRGGGWEAYLSVFHGVAKYSAGATGGGTGFRPWWILGRSLGEAPLLSAIAVAALLIVIGQLLRQRREAMNWEGNFPELLLLVGALGALLVNPTPYPYNILHFVPYAFLLAFRYGAGVWNQLWDRKIL